MARCGSQYFFLRLSQKDQFMSARAASASTSPKNPPKPRTPARIADTRYEIKRELRKERCDHCHELESGNAAGAFWHRQNTPTAGEREAAWERGEWDANWYCADCHMEYHSCSYERVCDMLGLTRRNAKNARYADGVQRHFSHF